MKKLQHGFTLIEIMVGLAIVAVLGAISVIAYGEYTAKAKAVDIVTQYEALRTRAATVLSNRSVEKCDDVQMMLNGRHPVGNSHAALGYDFVKITDKAYRPVLAVCGKADAGRDAVRVARTAHDSLARQAGAMEKDAVLTDSVVSFALRLTEGDQAICRTPVSNPVSPCDAAGAAQAKAHKAAYDQKKADLQAQQKSQATKQTAQQALQDKRNAAEQARLAADAARREAERLAAAAAEQKRLAAEAAKQAKALEKDKKNAHKAAQAQEDARAAAAAAEEARRAAEAARQEAARLAAAEEQRRREAEAAAAAAAAAHPAQCSMVALRTGQPANSGSAFPSRSTYEAPTAPSPQNPNPPPPNPLPVQAPGSECVVCGDPNKDTPCSDLDLVLAITAVCPDDKPFCANRVDRTGPGEKDFKEFRRCVDNATVVAELAKNPASCLPGRLGTPTQADGTTCHAFCYGDLCNSDTNPSQVGLQVTQCR